jgi:phage baseplate assembly protein V
MIKYGYISEVDVNLCRVRVQFPDYEMVSPFLPVLVQGSLGNKYFHVFKINDHVACLMEENMENGVCLGAIYDTQNQPSGGATGKTKVVFSDGTLVQYNEANSTLSVVAGTTTVEVKPGGIKIEKGGESLKQILSDIITQINLIIVTTPGGPSTLPLLNAAGFNAIASRITSFFA